MLDAVPSTRSPEVGRGASLSRGGDESDLGVAGFDVQGLGLRV